MFSGGTNAWMLWTAAKTKPPPGARSSIRRRTSSRTSDGVPNGRTRWVSTPPPQKTRSRPNCCLSWRVSIPRALTLDRVDDVHPDLDEVWVEPRRGATAMVEELGVRPALDGFEEPSLARLHERGVCLGTDHPAVLGGDVIPVGEDIDELADRLKVAIHGLDVDVRDPVHQPLGERAVGDHRHHEGLQSDGPAGLLEDPAADDAAPDEREVRAVSYTHLTLPTKRI